MYFHNVATHRHPRISTIKNLSWEPFHMSDFSHTPAETFVPGRCLELYEGSEALPRLPRGSADVVHFQPPSGGADDNTRYVLSWPPFIATPGLCSPSSASSDAPSVYYTPLTTSTFLPTSTSSPESSLMTPPREPEIGASNQHLIYDENFPPLQPKFLRAKAPLCRPVGHRRRILQTREPCLKGWARLRRDAPPALRMAAIEQEVTSRKVHYVLEFDEEEGLVEKQLPDSELALRMEKSLEHRRLLLNLLINGA